MRRGSTVRMKHNKQAARFDVAANAEKLTSRSGAAALRELADRLGLCDALGEGARAACPRGRSCTSPAECCAMWW